MSDVHPMHGGEDKGYRIWIGTVEFGENPAEIQPIAQPNIKKLKWSRTNNVKVHEIPYPKHKTMRTSKVSLYRLDIDFKSVKYDEVFAPILKMCEDVGPVWVDTRYIRKWMYITDYSFDQTEGNDDDNVDWTMSLQEVND
jgi:hypothetical protein